MSFNPAFPNPPQLLSASQPIFKANNQSLVNVFGVNHVNFNSMSANAGRHKWCEMLSINSPITFVPSPLTTGEGTIFTNTTSVSVDAFYTPQTTGNAYQLTRTLPANFGTFGNYTNYPAAVANQYGGWTFLPGGLLFQYGTMQVTGSTTIIKFPVPFTDMVNSPYSLTISIKSMSTAQISSETYTGFNVLTSAPSGTRIYWQAIGV